MEQVKGLCSIIVPCWNGEQHLVNCLNSVRDQSYKNIELLIVDNNSTDSSKTIIRDSFGDLKPRSIENPSNYGFARALNQGIDASIGEFVFALNTDVILKPDYIEKLISAMADKEVGSATGKLHRFPEDWEGRKIIDSTGHMLIVDAAVVNRGEEEEDAGQYDQVKNVFGVCAAAGMYRRKMLEDVKLEGQFYDEKFFVSLEDVDLDWRANLRGWKSVYVPEAFAYHKRYGTNWPLDEKLLINSKRNKMLLVLKNDFALNYLMNFPFVFAYGFEDFLYNHFKNYRLVFEGFYRFILAIPWALRKRSIVKKMRRITFRDFRKHINITNGDIKKLLDVSGTFIVIGILTFFIGARNTLLLAALIFFVLNPVVFYAKKLAAKRS